VLDFAGTRRSLTGLFAALREEKKEEEMEAATADDTQPLLQLPDLDSDSDLEL
jgi:hypothetical protein